MNITELSLTELRRLNVKIDAEIKRRSNTKRKALLKKMKKMAEEEGLSLHDVIGTEIVPASAEKTQKRAVKGKKASAPVPMKYRSKTDPVQEWSGRGRRPQWVLDWLGQGKTIELLEIAAGNA